LPGKTCSCFLSARFLLLIRIDVSDVEKGNLAKIFQRIMEAKQHEE